MQTYSIRNGFIAKAKQQTDWGKFIEPDRELESFADPNQKYKITVTSGYKADFNPFQHDQMFSAITAKIIKQRETMSFEDQCSAKYYYDVFNAVRLDQQKIDRVVEIGTMFGGSSCIFASGVVPFNFALDLVEIQKPHLLLTYERIRRAFPEATPRIRLFLGTLPMYVSQVMRYENQTKTLVHHDASHNFNEVVKDLAILYYVQSKMMGLMIQDTHLRCTNTRCSVYVDMALCAVFGYQFKGIGMGVSFPKTLDPGSSSGSYFIDSQIEGFYLRFSENCFQYPHPSMQFEDVYSS